MLFPGGSAALRVGSRLLKSDGGKGCRGRRRRRDLGGGEREREETELKARFLHCSGGDPLFPGAASTHTHTHTYTRTHTHTYLHTLKSTHAQSAEMSVRRNAAAGGGATGPTPRAQWTRARENLSHVRAVDEPDGRDRERERKQRERVERGGKRERRKRPSTAFFFFSLSLSLTANAAPQTFQQALMLPAKTVAAAAADERSLLERAQKAAADKDESAASALLSGAVGPLPFVFCAARVLIWVWA